MSTREVAVGALGTVYAVQEGNAGQSLGQILHQAWSSPTALAFLAWYDYAPQCMASPAMARRKTDSRRWTTFIAVYLFGFAYAAAATTYWTAKALGL